MNKSNEFLDTNPLLLKQKCIGYIPSSEYQPTEIQVSLSLSIGSSFKQVAVTVSPNCNGVSNSNNTTSPEYKKCLNFVY